MRFAIFKDFFRHITASLVLTRTSTQNS